MNRHKVLPPCSRSRRHLLVAAGTALALGQRAFAQTDARKPSCVLTPAQTEGPYFVDERLERADIRVDPADGSTRPGAPLVLRLRVASLDGGRCVPVAAAIVNVWHCDAQGIYSDVNNMAFGTRGSKFLRGYQVTDAEGRVTFRTIYPGAYPGRAVHVHFKVRAKANGSPREFTSQLYFDDALTDRVHREPPYGGLAEPRTRNAADGLYRRGGRELQLDVTPTSDGFEAAYDVGLRSA